MAGGKDWQQMRDRLARACAALEQGHQLTPERARAILEERARLLARVPPQAPQAGDVVEVLIFSLGEERYGIGTEHVREVLRFQEFTPLPGAPAYLLGITNVRGQILALFDPRQLFGLAPKEVTPGSRIMILGDERAELGVLADSVTEVARLRTDEVLEPPGTIAAGIRAFVRGVTEQALIVLDGSVMLADPRLFIDLGSDGNPAAGEMQGEMQP